jgi:hypothetical protein
MPTEKSPAPVPQAHVAAPASSSPSLLQADREKKLNTARWIMIVSGILWLGINGILLTQKERFVEQRVQSRIEEIRSQGKMEKRNSEEEIQWCSGLRRVYLKVFGGSAAVGVALIFFGVLVNRLPVPCTLAGLLLCLAATAAYRYCIRDMQIESWIWRIFTIIALIIAVVLAMTAPQEKKSAKRAAVFIPR